MYQRLINIQLPSGRSAFLWGARQTGKSTYLKHAFPESFRIDFLIPSVFEQYLKNPSLLAEVIKALPPSQRQLPIIIDEIQKVPPLLDMVHYLIENEGVSFILCGSSARKLKRGGANLLGGRAWRFECYPLTSIEVGELDLLKALNQGLLPSIYSDTQSNARHSLRSYISEYLREEIQEEGLVRNLPAFAKFLDAAAFCSGELLNYTKIAADCAVDQKTVKEYFQILYDTLIGYEVLPYRKIQKRDIITRTPKFYYFDTGVYNQLAGHFIDTLDGVIAGKLFEHWVLIELMAYRGYHHLNHDICYWRTKTGLEVDFIVGPGEIAIEVKLNQHVRYADLRGLRAFKEENPDTRAYVVSLDHQARQLENGIIVLPWQEFTKRLWNNAL